MPLGSFALALATAAVAAVAFFPALRLPRRGRGVILLVLIAVILCSPLLVPQPFRFLRLLAALFAITLTLQLYDLHANLTPDARPGFASVLLFLPNVFRLVHHSTPSDQPRSAGANLLNAARHGTIMIPGLV